MPKFLPPHNAGAAHSAESAYNHNSPPILSGQFPFCVEALGVQLSAPMIDKIILSGIVLLDGDPDDFVVQLTAQVESLSKAKAFAITKKKYRAYKPIRKLAWFLLVAGPRERPVRVELRVDHKASPKQLRLRLDFNPRKLLKSGLKELRRFLACLGGIDLDHAQWLQTAFISRIDVAVDILGARPGDLIVQAPDATLRRLYVGKDDLETEYLSKRTKYADRRSISDLARIYDRGALKRAAGKTPPWGSQPLARVELLPTMAGRKMTLTKLRAAKCLFEGVRISHVGASPAASSPLWLNWVDIARARGPQHASRRLALAPELAWQFEKEWRIPSTVLVPVNVLWEHWGAAFEKADLGLLLEA